MADRIKPGFMRQVLEHQNWALATKGSNLVFERDRLFPVPRERQRPALVVPVDVQALYVPTNHSERFVKLPMGLSGGQDEAEPFAAPQPRPKGVHLHWALPDGLMRGELTNDKDNPVRSQVLPDRWLVVRMTGPKNSRILQLRGWVIESESQRVFDWATYPNGMGTPEGKRVASDELDGTVGGSPAWTAGYDAALNRFSFHDNLVGVNPTKVTTKLATYVVVGWWSKRANDPLASSYSSLMFSRKLKSYDWSASAAPMSKSSTYAWKKQDLEVSGGTPARRKVDPEQIDLKTSLKMTTSQNRISQVYQAHSWDKTILPRHLDRYETVMHGTVYGVPITGGIGRDTAPAASRIETALAPTLETVMASMAAKGLGLTATSRKEYLERLITGVANSSLLNLNEPDGVVLMDEAEHKDGFETFQGPDTYEDVIIERPREAIKAGRPARTKQALLKSRSPKKSEVMWTGRKAGATKHQRLYHMRERASEQILLKEGIGVRGRPGANIPSEKVRRIRRPGPRYFRSAPPVIGLRNFGRAPRFREDGRFRDDGKLDCRWDHELSTGFGEFYRSEDYVPQATNPVLPDTTNDILQHSYLYDPYMMNWAFQAIETNLSRELAGPVQNRLRGEMALRYSTDGVYNGTSPIARSGRVRPGMTEKAVTGELLRFSLFEGKEPSPVAITSWAQPWSPIWLEWEAEIEPGPGLDGWSLGRIDFIGKSEGIENFLKIRGRLPITTGLTRSYQSAIESYLIAEAQRDESDAGEIGENHENNLADLADYLSTADLGSVTLSEMSNIWLALKSGPDGQEIPIPEDTESELKSVGLPRLLSAGTLRLTKARVIDTFGRFRNVNVGRTIVPVAHEGKNRSGQKALKLPPRLSVPARLMFRFTNPAKPPSQIQEASLNQQNPALTINPISGYILPDFIDEAVEFFDHNGNPLGQVMHDSVTGGLIWEGGVGREGPASSLPENGLEPSARPCGKIAQGMIDTDIAMRADPELADKESPLSAFLRAVDTTMWTVDGSLNFAGATIAGLVGRPVAVVTARLWLDIPKNLKNTGAYGEQADAIRDYLIRESVYDAIKSQEFQIRLGEKHKGHDGLYGYFINDDYSRFHLIEKNIATAGRATLFNQGFRSILGTIGSHLGTDLLPAPSPLDSPYIDASEELPLHAGQKVRLTLLMHPQARVHATSGFLPRKSIELLKEWVKPGLEKIAPSARIGPVIIDPDKVRLPKIAAYGAEQTWTRRDSPITWKNDPILSATQAALLPDGRVTLEEGYVRITPLDEQEGDDS